MEETESIDQYILQHIDEEGDYLKALYRDTHVKLLRPRTFARADAENVCPDDSSPSGIGNRHL